MTIKKPPDDAYQCRVTAALFEKARLDVGGTVAYNDDHWIIVAVAHDGRLMLKSLNGGEVKRAIAAPDEVFVGTQRLIDFGPVFPSA
jgi:hypothetical protein